MSDNTNMSDNTGTGDNTDIELRLFPAEQLHAFSRQVFRHCGVPDDEATLAADVLSASDLRGIDSHGIARLIAYYGMLDAGRINPRPNVTIVRQSASTATVDGDNGLGLVVGPHANRIAMDKADEAGSGWVAVRNSNHYGIAGYYVLEALRRDQIGWAMTNTTRVVTPLWGRERILGTNPIAIAFPGDEEPPVVIDMATTATAFGRVEMALRKQKPIAEGWAIDNQGRATTDPAAVIDGGALLPLGSDREHGGHKGYCLAAMVDLLSGPLGGASWGPFTPAFSLQYDSQERTVGIGLGHFFGALKIEAFTDTAEFKRQTDDWVRTMRSTLPLPGTDGPIIPGDPERIAEQRRSQEGIPLIESVIDDLQDLSRQTGIPFDC